MRYINTKVSTRACLFFLVSLSILHGARSVIAQCAGIEDRNAEVWQDKLERAGVVGGDGGLGRRDHVDAGKGVVPAVGVLGAGEDRELGRGAGGYAVKA